MTDTAIIGALCPIGQFWSAKRYYDYLIDESNLMLLRGKDFGQLVVICPSLWEGTKLACDAPEKLASRVKELINVLMEVKAERVTFVTSIDTQSDTGNELEEQRSEFDSPYLSALAEFRDFLNLRFGRVLNVFLPELLHSGADVCVVDYLKSVPSDSSDELQVALLERHQLYPMQRLIHDVEKAWESSLVYVNLVPEPVTTFELVEKCFPQLVDRLPISKESDPYGSARTSVYSMHYHDPNTGYIMTKDEVFESVMQ